MSKTHKQNKHTLAHTLVLLDITKSYSRLYMESHSLIYHLLDNNAPIRRPSCLLFKKPKKSSSPVLSRQQSQKVTTSGLLSDASAASSVTELRSLNQQCQRRGRARRPRAPQAPSRARPRCSSCRGRGAVWVQRGDTSRLLPSALRHRRRAERTRKGWGAPAEVQQCRRVPAAAAAGGCATAARSHGAESLAVLRAFAVRE